MSSHRRAVQLAQHVQLARTPPSPAVVSVRGTAGHCSAAAPDIINSALSAAKTLTGCMLHPYLHGTNCQWRLIGISYWNVAPHRPTGVHAEA